MTDPATPATPADEVIALCDHVCDGTLTADGRARLEALVLGDPALRRLYVERMHLHATLKQQSSRLSEAPLAEVLRPVTPSAPLSFSSSAHAAGPSRIVQLWNAAAALFLVAIGAWWLTTRTPDGGVALLVEADNARWGGSTLPTAPGSLLTQGRLHLSDGLARVRFNGGAEVTLEGPAELELIDHMRCRLHRGSLVAHVPERAKGFTVLTRQATVIDHGTDFGISADAEGHANVHVLQGEVELRHATGGPSLRLLTQQMAAVTPAGLQNLTGQELEPGNRRERAPEESFAHELTTASGRGAAVYRSSPGTDRHFSDTLLLVKNGPAENYRRKALLRFDLGGIGDPQRLTTARLTLHFDLSGYGFASLGGDAQFVVYALTDDTRDDWDPEALTWSGMPAFHPDAGRVDATRAVAVGRFTMPLGVLRGPQSIEGPELLARIKSDGNRLLTLIVVRENPLTKDAGVVHGFAGNRHPTLPPPTLRLR